MKQLSRAEEKVLHIIWAKEPAYMKDIMETHPSPKPAKTTLATVLRRMIDKGYIKYELEGSIRKYYSLVKRGTYLKNKLRTLIGSFFDSSPTQFASFFAEEMELSDEEIMEIKNMYQTLNRKE